MCIYVRFLTVFVVQTAYPIEHMVLGMSYDINIKYEGAHERKEFRHSDAVRKQC